MKRSYRQNCALASALDLVGERWTLLIVRELLIEPRRYGELLDNLAGIGTNLLADRLRELETRSLIRKLEQRYELTDLGRLLEPVVRELIRFGLALGIEDAEDRQTRPEWDVVALRAIYQPARGGSLRGRSMLELNGHPFCIEKIGDDIRVTHTRACEDPEVSVALDKRTARSLANGEVTFDHALENGDILVRGRKRVARALLRSFSLLP